jgi:hypothetical protein
MNGFKRFSVVIRWRGYRWTLRALAVNSVALVCGMLDHVPADARVQVTAL